MLAAAFTSTAMIDPIMAKGEILGIPFVMFSFYLSLRALTRDRIDVRAPAFPVAENVTGELVTDPARLRELVGRQVVSPVAWEAGVRSLVAAGATVLVEAGVGDVLTKLMKRIDPGVTAVAVGSPDAAREAVASLPG